MSEACSAFMLLMKLLKVHVVFIIRFSLVSYCFTNINGYWVTNRNIIQNDDSGKRMQAITRIVNTFSSNPHVGF